MDEMDLKGNDLGSEGGDLPAGNPGGSRVTVVLSEEDRRFLARVFSLEDVAASADDIAQLAFQEWIAWISGVRRYNTTSDQAIERIIDIYSAVMPNEEPSVAFLYNRLNIPFGRARYIVQAIVNRQLHELNRRAWDRLVDALEAKWAEYDAYLPSEQKVLHEIRFVVDLRAEKLLTTIVDQMPLSKRPVSTFRRLPSPLPNTREYSLAPNDLKPVLEAVRNFQV